MNITIDLLKSKLRELEERIRIQEDSYTDEDLTEGDCVDKHFDYLNYMQGQVFILKELIKVEEANIVEMATYLVGVGYHPEDVNGYDSFEIVRAYKTETSK